MCSASHCPFSEVPTCLGHWPVPCVQPHGAHMCFFSFPRARLLSAHAAHCHLSSVLASVLLCLPTLSFSSTSFPQANPSGTARARSLSPGGQTKTPPRLGRLWLGCPPLEMAPNRIYLVRRHRALAEGLVPFRLLVLTALSQKHINQGSPAHPMQTCTSVCDAHELQLPQLSHFSPAGFETPMLPKPP